MKSDQKKSMGKVMSEGPKKPIGPGGILPKPLMGKKK